MDDLLTRALSVKEHIKGMEPLAQLEYVAKLYNDMSASPIISDMNTFCKAQEAVGGIWKYLAADFKERSPRSWQKGYRLYLSALSEKLMVKTTPRLSM